MPIFVGEESDATVLQTSGSTKFGNSSDDIHNFQGNMYVTGALHASTQVGIGTSSPSGLLHISTATTDATLIIEADTDNNAEGDNPILILRQDGGNVDSAIYHSTSPSNNDLHIASAVNMVFSTSANGRYASATQKMVITDDGKVGIGTTAPDRGLEINHSSGGSIRLTYNDSDGSASDYADMSVGANGALTLATIDSDGLAGDLTLDADGDIYLNADNGTVIFADDTTSYMTISNNSSHSFIRSLVADKDIQLATTDSNIVATVDSEDDAFKINRRLGLGVYTSLSTGTLSTTPFSKIVNTTTNDITGAVPDSGMEGEVKVILGLASSSGNNIVTYKGPAGTTVSKTLTNGIAVILVSFDATGAGAYRWAPVGDVS